MKNQFTSLVAAAFLSVGLMTSASAELVNLNKADAETLAYHLSGIGESKAEAIIEYRNTNGAFESVEEITNVPGIGDKTFEIIKADLSVDKGADKL